MMNKEGKIYVAGHRGMVGSAIVRSLERNGYHNIITRTHKELDLTRQDQVEKFFAEEKPCLLYTSQALAKIPEKDLVKLVLTGELLPELTPDVDWMETKLKEAYYFLKVKDQTRLLIRPEDYQYDVCLLYTSRCV